jgi:hypothetical protein
MALTMKTTALKAAQVACAIPIDDLDAVKAAETRMAETGATAERAEGRLLRFEQVLDPNRRVAGNQSGFSEADYLEARQHRESAYVEYAGARTAFLQAKDAFHQLRDEEKARRLKLLEAASCEVATAMFEKLRSISVNENRTLSMLDEARRQVCGGSITVPCAWVEFMASDRAFDGRLDVWHRVLKGEGLIE